jgi:hypothetical protein
MRRIDFIPRVDPKRRLVVTRFNSGIGRDGELFCYQVWKISKGGKLDKKFKPLYSFGGSDFGDIKQFKHSGSGEVVKVMKTPLKPFRTNLNDPVDIYREFIKKQTKNE